jgi:hypothetical protein
LKENAMSSDEAHKSWAGAAQIVAAGQVGAVLQDFVCGFPKT